jgi:UDP-N-acetylglucosamine pyrophosphorylase
MKIITKKSIEVLDDINSKVSYLPIPNSLLDSLKINSTDNLIFELVPIETELSPSKKIYSEGILITNPTGNE